MIVEPRSSATILALADLADLSAKQLEDGCSIEEVIETLRKAAVSVRNVVKDDEAKTAAEELAEASGAEDETSKIADFSA
ncbi:hypothetical protein [Roseibium limicola]|uniref:Uncharacterized protein n=1 Tax=Roseibium limicola TaxID=2816037 RepID=A0A939ES63_9HYPH|nr:hypothetical protein [Roseibium limicola]MBO0347117.1 hypothetical protein [Roseibium limicola]